MSTFNDYLKYVKGHSANATSIVTALPDRLSTAITRRFAEEVDVTDVPLFKIGKIRSYTDFIHIICNPIGGYKYKIDIDLDDYDINITHKADGEYESSIFTDSNIQLRTTLNHYIDLEDYFNTEADNEVSRYFRDGVDKIGMVNVKTNIIVIAILEILDSSGFFYIPSEDASEESKEDKPAISIIY